MGGVSWGEDSVGMSRGSKKSISLANPDALHAVLQRSNAGIQFILRGAGLPFDHSKN